MSINSRNKGAAFERQIANALIEDLNLTNPVKRILEQTRTRELPDLMLGNWCIECKAYGARVNLKELLQSYIESGVIPNEVDFSSDADSEHDDQETGDQQRGGQTS